MFDIGFAELVVIGVVALLVIGPERLPATVRTASLWINRIRRGFNEIKREVQQELHNDNVMQDLRETGDRLKQDAEKIGQDIKTAADTAANSLAPPVTPATPTTPASPEVEPKDKIAE